ncbi:hypothetical protein [Pseudomonas extremaustralis]|uniref:hypothetical protein n=1 Tax=Pseudomonas extremaustralis TaxID=359110 RepID=UPI00286623FE|nr:hypothetical protein [Pseudomonas extremaustralis]MDR6581633.1 hypothetical protein [Pseudomonas extremaustralis]
MVAVILECCGEESPVAGIIEQVESNDSGLSNWQGRTFRKRYAFASHVLRARHMDDVVAWAGWSMVGEFFKLVPGLILFPLSFVLAWKKFGNKALITYSLSHDRYSAPRLTDIALTNCKDRPLVVHALYIIVDRHILVPLKEFSPPLVVKGLESALIECDPVTSYHVGEHSFEFDFLNIGEIYVLTTGGRFKCDADPTPTLTSIAKNEGYQHVHTRRRIFNTHVFNDGVRYGLTFSAKGKSYTAFVDDGGIIGLEWPFQINALRSEDMTDALTVKTVLEELYGELMDGPLHVTVLNNPELGRPGGPSIARSGE